MYNFGCYIVLFLTHTRERQTESQRRHAKEREEVDVDKNDLEQPWQINIKPLLACVSSIFLFPFRHKNVHVKYHTHTGYSTYSNQVSQFSFYSRCVLHYRTSVKTFHFHGIERRQVDVARSSLPGKKQNSFRWC